MFGGLELDSFPEEKGGFDGQPMLMEKIPPDSGVPAPSACTREGHRQPHAQDRCFNINANDRTATDATTAPRTSSLAASIVIPTRVDVLLGRGHSIQRHKGNTMFRHLVASQIDIYEKAGKMEKNSNCGGVSDVAKRSSGRFLKPREDDSFEEVDDNTARLKTASAFRSIRKERKRGSYSECPLADTAVAVHEFYHADPEREGGFGDFPGGSAKPGAEIMLPAGRPATPPAEAKASVLIWSITSSDVLFGRGRGLLNHPGNQAFRSLIASRLVEHEKASKIQKANVAEEVIACVKAALGRFLRPLDNDRGWEQVDDHIAHLKVASGFWAFRKVAKQGEMKPRKIVAVSRQRKA